MSILITLALLLGLMPDMTVTANAFANCQKLQALPSLPALESIGNSAFKGCIALTKVTLGAKVKKIGKEAFRDCNKLKTVMIKTKNLKKKTVGKNCFKGIAADAVFKCPKKSLKHYTKWLASPGGAPKTAKFK